MIFFLNVPIGLIALVVAFRVVRESTAETARHLDMVGLGLGTDKEKHVPYRPLLFDSRLLVAPGHRGESFRRVAMKVFQFGVRSKLDVWRGVDAIDQIA